MFEGNINCDINLYQSCVLKMANINLFDPFLLLFRLLHEIIRFCYGIDELSEQQHTPNITLTSTKLTKLTAILLIIYYILLAIIVLFGCNLNADCNTISNSLQ